MPRSINEAIEDLSFTMKQRICYNNDMKIKYRSKCNGPYQQVIK